MESNYPINDAISFAQKRWGWKTEKRPQTVFISEGEYSRVRIAFLDQLGEYSYEEVDLVQVTGLEGVRALGYARGNHVLFVQPKESKW